MKIKGVFSSMKEAKEAVNKLKEAGFRRTYMDMNDIKTTRMNLEPNIAGSENAPSLSDLVLGSGSVIVEDKSKAALAAASPMVSGMGTFEDISNISCKVVVDTENDSEMAKQIIAGMGGNIY